MPWAIEPCHGSALFSNSSWQFACTSQGEKHTQQSILKNQHFHQIIHFPTDFSITRSQCIKNSEFKLFADAMVQKQPVVRQDLKI